MSMVSMRATMSVMGGGSPDGYEERQRFWYGTDRGVGPVPIGMRVQLQRQHGGRTIHHASEVLLVEPGGDVLVNDVAAALRRLAASDVIPRREHGRAERALGRALGWLDAWPPRGVSGRFSKSFYFSPERPGESWRFDIEGLQGTHLRRP